MMKTINAEKLIELLKDKSDYYYKELHYDVYIALEAVWDALRKSLADAPPTSTYFYDFGKQHFRDSRGNIIDIIDMKEPPKTEGDQPEDSPAPLENIKSPEKQERKPKRYSMVTYPIVNRFAILDSLAKRDPDSIVGHFKENDLACLITDILNAQEEKNNAR